MRPLIYVTILAMVLSFAGIVYSDESDNQQRSSGNGALTGALLGGLLGGGLGAGIGSASGHAGTGALIGAGVGALGGGLIGANQQAKEEAEQSSYAEPAAPQNQPVKKRVLRQYDADGNVISEKEVQ